MKRDKQISVAAHDYVMNNPPRRMYDAFLAGARWADSHSQWVNVVDELPPYNVKVLVFSDDDPLCEMWWSERYIEGYSSVMSIDGTEEYRLPTDKNGFASMCDDNNKPLQVTHWLKITEPSS